MHSTSSHRSAGPPDILLAIVISVSVLVFVLLFVALVANAM